MDSFFAILPFKKEEPIAICDSKEMTFKIRKEFKAEGINTYYVEMTEAELIHYISNDYHDDGIFDHYRKGFDNI